MMPPSFSLQIYALLFVTMIYLFGWYFLNSSMLYGRSWFSQWATNSLLHYFDYFSVTAGFAASSYIYISISCFLPQNNVHNYSPFPLPNFSTLLPSFNLWEHWWSHPRSKMVIKLTTWASQVGMDASFLFLKIDVWQVTKLYSHLDG